MPSEEVQLRIVSKRKQHPGSPGSRSPLGSRSPVGSGSRSPSGSPTHHVPNIQRMASTISNKSIKSMDVCVFLKDQSMHEIYLENACTTNAGTLFTHMLDCLSLPPEASQVFSLWLTSPLLQLQLKPHHIPFRLCRQWPDLLDKYTTHGEEEKAKDQPVICFQRNAFYPKDQEKKITCDKILIKLFQEAKRNILDGMYPCDPEDYEYLAGMLAWLQYGQFDAQSHQLGFFKDNDLHKILPACMFKGGSRWMSIKSRTGGMLSVEASILQHWKHFSEKLTKKIECYTMFLQFCWKLPFYGSVFFMGQIERTGGYSVRVRDTPDRPVFIGINRDGVYVIDKEKQELLLGLMFDELSWEYTEPVRGVGDCLPCLWLEFDSHERGKWCSKVLQIFSKQAVMMNALIEASVEELNKRDENTLKRHNHTVVQGLLSNENTRIENQAALEATAPVFGALPAKEPKTSLCTKMDRLCLATFSDKGELISKKPKVKRSFTLQGLFSR